MSDASVAILKYLGYIPQRIYLLLVIVSVDFVCLSFQNISDHLDDRSEGIVGNKEMRFNESMTQFYSRSRSVVEMGD